MHRLHVRPLQVDDDQVRLLAGGEHVAVGQAHGLRTADRCHVQHIVRREGGRVAAAQLLQHGGQIHLAEEIERVVARRAVGADGHMDAQSPHLLERGDAAGELGVRAGVRDSPEPAIPEDLQIVLRHVHAVKAPAAVVKVAEGCKQLRRRLAPAVLTLGHLARGLGIVREHRRVQRAGQLAGLGHLGDAGGVLRVQAKLIGDQRMQGVEFAVLALELLCAAAAPAQHRAEAAVDARLRDGLAKIVHIKAGRDAAREILEDGQLCKRIHRLGRELGLQREDLLKQPRLQRHIVGIRAHNAGVRVRVLKARHHEIAAEVDLPLERGQRLRRGTNIGDLVPIGPDLVRRDGHAVRHRERAAMEKADHRLSLRFLKCSCIIRRIGPLGNRFRKNSQTG